MSNQPREIIRRRPRCVFHYKVDEMLRAEDREAYLSLLRDPRTTVDIAHAWLLERNYRLSRSAVARHRRRHLAGETEQRESMDLAMAFAHVAGTPDAPNFAAGASVHLQYLVFQRLLVIDDIMRAAGANLCADDDDVDEDERADRVAKAFTQIPSSELLTLSKLVRQCVELARAVKREQEQAPAQTKPVAPPGTAEQRLARERARADEILFGRTPKRDQGGADHQ